MGKIKILLLAIGILAALVGCTRQAAPAADSSRDTLAFLRHYGSFSDAEAKKITRQIKAGPHDLAIQLAAAGREHILLKLGDLQPTLPPPEQNAAPIYIQLMRLLKAHPLDPATDKVTGSLGMRVPHSPEELDAVRRMLSQRKDVMQLVHEAANKSECVFQRDWSRGLLLEFPEYPTIREAARLLSAESYFLARDGHYQEAIANQARVFRIAEHPTADPCAIGQLVGIACDEIALAGMDNVLCLAGPNPEVAETLRTTVATHRPPLRLRRTLEGEIALFSIGINGLRRGAPAEDQVHRQLQQFYGSGSTAVPPDILQEYPPMGRPLTNHLLDAAQASHLHLARILVEASQQPYVAAKPLLQNVRELAATSSRNPIQQLGRRTKRWSKCSRSACGIAHDIKQ
jgi:hypothetical protein